MEAILALEDGRIFRGRAFGSVGEVVGEIVFNTSMTGYQELLTDPSYHGQIVAMTCPEVGNYGTNIMDQESEGAHVEGFVVREISVMPSSWRATQSLPQFLRERGIPGVSEIDTRALTRHIRSRGAMRAILSSVDRSEESLIARARKAPQLHDHDLVADVTCKDAFDWREPRLARWQTAVDPCRERMRCVAFDFGIKRNILRLLHEHGFDVTVVPAAMSSGDVLALRPDVLFLSNGPGDPTVPAYAIRTVKELIGKLPLFGICLGHQIAALALGGRTFKLKFGHRGANHPVKDLRSGRVAITSQNHGYAVDPESLPSDVQVTHINLNDQTCEGYFSEERRIFAVQYHPESSPGPHDSVGLFDEFRAMVSGK